VLAEVSLGNSTCNAKIVAITTTIKPEIQVNDQAMSSEQFKEIENIVPPYTPRPQVEGIQFDENNNYNCLVFDTETNTTGKLAKICQLSVCDMFKSI
jgi:hypothetical protein